MYIVPIEWINERKSVLNGAKRKARYANPLCTLWASRPPRSEASLPMQLSCLGRLCRALSQQTHTQSRAARLSQLAWTGV